MNKPIDKPIPAGRVSDQDRLELRCAVAEHGHSTAVCAGLEQAILSASPQWQQLLAERQVRDQRAAALDAVRARLREEYGLSDRDAVDFATGEITRAPAGN